MNLEASYQKVLNRNNIIMLAPAGSELLGLSRKGVSDRDEMGIVLETPSQLLGFNPFEQEIYRTAEERTGKVNEPSQDGDIDLTLYGLRKFVRLALSGNPNLIGMLYIPKEKCMVYTNIAEELQELAPYFLSKRTASAFLGYMQGQRQRLMGQRGQKDVNRPELEAKHGFDVKYGMHMMQLAFQCYKLVTTKRLEYPIEDKIREYLNSIRSGEYGRDRIIEDAIYYEDLIKEYIDSSSLQDKPNITRIEEWLLGIYKRELFNEDKTTSQQQGFTSDQEGKDPRASEGNSEAAWDSIPF